MRDLATVITVALACMASVLLTAPAIARAFEIDMRQPVECSVVIYSGVHEEHVRLTTCYVEG